jgi:maltose/maltodextrin transport system substrate-binding protein
MLHPKLSKAITATALILAGGLAFTASAADGGKLLVWINGDKGYKGLQKVGDEFAKKTGVKVTVEHPEDAPGKFQAAAEEGKGPDIWIWAHDRAGEWAASGIINPVNPGKKIKDDIDPKTWQAFTIGGKIWAYPIAVEAVALIYNKALVPNPPKTFEEIFAMDKKLQASGKHAILWDYNNTYFTWPLLGANGGYAFKQKADGTYAGKDTGVNNAGAVQGAEMLNRLIKEGVMPKGASYAEMEAGMAQGKVAMMISGPWAWENVAKAKINYGVALIPSVGGKKAAPFVGVTGAMITKTCANPEVAKEFIENYMLSPKGLKMIDDDVPLGTPASKSAFEKMKNNPKIQVSMQSAQNGTIMPNNPEMGRFWAAMVSALTNMTEGRQQPKEALDAAAKRITK